jgi:hypothetical protein
MIRFGSGSLLVACALAALLVPVPAAAQSAAGILNTALERHDARMRNVQNYTLVQQVMGTQTTMYFEREMVDGRPVFQPREVGVLGQNVPVGADGWESPDPYAGLAELAERARYQGVEVVDGHNTHVLVIDDFRGLRGFDPSPQQQDMEFRRGTLYVDAADYVLRRMVMEGEATTQGQRQPVTMDVRMEDYRNVDGVLHPFRTVIKTDGLAPGVSAAEMEEARRSMAQLKAQMESMPAAQREMMERMVRPQMEQFERMMAGGGMEITMEVTDLRVNAGPPAAR